MSERGPDADMEAERARNPLWRAQPYRSGQEDPLVRDYLSHRANHIPAGERVFNIVLALCLLGYGAYGLAIDDLIIPGRRRDYHLHGDGALSMYAAMCLIGAMLIAVVVDHYDKRDNEVRYRMFANVTKYAAVACWILSIFLNNRGS
jgi:hypothetical protein